MANEITIKVNGLRELGQKLRSLGPKLEAEGLTKSVYSGADIVRNAAKATTEWKDVSGLLRSNIIVAKRRGEPHSATYRVTVRWVRYRNNKTNRLRGTAGKLLERNPRMYGAFLEFGTSKMEARPYLRPAFFNNLEDVIGAIGTGLRDAVLTAAR